MPPEQPRPGQSRDRTHHPRDLLIAWKRVGRALARLLFVLAALAFAPAPLGAQPATPHVLFIAVDDLNDWIGPLGGYRGTALAPVTPHLDRLAAMGMTFRNAHCASPACHPSRVAVMTGTHPGVSGISINQQSGSVSWRTGPLNGTGILANAVTISQYFRNRGYLARGAGKIFHALQWNNNDENDYATWDEYFDPPNSQSPTDFQPVPNFPSPYTGWPGSPLIFFHWSALTPENTKIGSRAFVDADMADTKIVNWVLPRIAADLAQPLFQAVGIFRPHIPWHVPQSFLDLYPIQGIETPRVLEGDLLDTHGHSREPWHDWILAQDAQSALPTQWEYAMQGYLASITYADSQIGRLLDQLDSNAGNPAKMNWQNTVVVLWSDHGMHLGEKRNWEKFTLWEESTRVPLLIAAPGVATPGSTCDQAVSTIDIYPTLVDLSGGTRAGLHILDGESLVPLLQNPNAPRHMPAITVYVGETSVRTARWRYIRYFDGGTYGNSEELYDHANDPDEFTNLIPQVATNPEYAAARAELSRWVDYEYRLASGETLAGNTIPRRPSVAGRPILIRSRIDNTDPDGVIVAQGSAAAGYAFYLAGGHLAMAVKKGASPAVVTMSPAPLPPGQSKVFGWLRPDGVCTIGIEGQVLGSTDTGGLFATEPGETLSAGLDADADVVAYANESFTGALADLEINLQASPDTDGDGATDGDEAVLGIDPRNADTDGDGVSDGAEIAAGTDPGSNMSEPPPHVPCECAILIDFGPATAATGIDNGITWNNVSSDQPSAAIPDPNLEHLAIPGTLCSSAGTETGITFSASATGEVGISEAPDESTGAAPSSSAIPGYWFPALAAKDGLYASGDGAYEITIGSLREDFTYDFHLFGASSAPGISLWEVRGAGPPRPLTLSVRSNAGAVASFAGISPDSNGQIAIRLRALGGPAAGTARWNTLEIRARPLARIFQVDLAPPDPIAESVALSWPSLPGFLYRVRHSLDLLSWTELASDLPSQGTQTDFTAPVGEMAAGNPVFYQVLESAGLPGSGSLVDFAAGFPASTSLLGFNGSAQVSGSRARLTDGGSDQAGTVWTNALLDIRSFHCHFAFQITDAGQGLADGFTFAIQGAGALALGNSGEGLGIGGVTPSFAVKLDTAPDCSNTGVLLNGEPPAGGPPDVDMTGDGIDLHSGHVFQVSLDYDGAVLRQTVTDTDSAAVFTREYAIDIPAVIGGNEAYIGFTGSTGGQTATQDILGWIYSAAEPR